MRMDWRMLKHTFKAEMWFFDSEQTNSNELENMLELTIKNQFTFQVPVDVQNCQDYKQIVRNWEENIKRYIGNFCQSSTWPWNGLGRATIYLAKNI